VRILIQVYFNSSLTYLLMRKLKMPHNVASSGALVGANIFFELVFTNRRRHTLRLWRIPKLQIFHVIIFVPSVVNFFSIKCEALFHPSIRF
jgi:hypothetical protein